MTPLEKYLMAHYLPHAERFAAGATPESVGDRSTEGLYVDIVTLYAEILRLRAMLDGKDSDPVSPDAVTLEEALDCLGSVSWYSKHHNLPTITLVDQLLTRAGRTIHYTDEYRPEEHADSVTLNDALEVIESMTRSTDSPSDHQYGSNFLRRAGRVCP